MALNIGVVGATGVVGQTFLQLIDEQNFPVNEIRLFASKNSLGQAIPFKGRSLACTVLANKCFEGLDLVFFSSGDEISKKWAPHAVECGAFAVDNSAAFRMSDYHKLIVPEINGHTLPSRDKPEVIANPNCSTIQLVMALAPLALKFGINDVKVSTYQSVSGAGKAGKEELINQLKELVANKEASNLAIENFAHQIAFNSLPHIGSFNDQGFCSEEVKIMSETRKILNMPSLKVSAFTVRVPSLNGHGEAVWVTLDEAVKKEQVEAALGDFKNLKYIPHSQESTYPHVLQADGENDTFVGRLHADPNDPRTWMMWVVADNLRKGAALNGLQIAQHIFL